MSLFSQIFNIFKTKPVEQKAQDSKKLSPKFRNQPVKNIPLPQSQAVSQQERRNLEAFKEAELAQARAHAKEIILEAKDQAFKINKQAEEENRKNRNDLISIENRIVQKEEVIDRKITNLEEKEKILQEKEIGFQQKLAEIEKIKQEQIAKLERAASLTRDEAKRLILEALNNRLKEEKAKLIKETEIQAKEEAHKKAKQILVEAMQKAATDYVAEYTVSEVKIPDEDIKGRIIGKEGRNIRAFELATGVDVDLDEQGVVRLSSFDPVRREIARLSLEKLIADGRIQPVKIEDLVKRIKEDLEKIMFEEGEKLCHTVGVYNLPSDKIALLGRFKYRFSYGQNMIAHTIEETKLGIMLAREVGADVNIVRLGCLLHDIGKVIPDEEGSHVNLAVELLRKNNLPEEVINCVAEHHEDKPFSSIESVLVYIADAISGARPGARFEDYDAYVKRLTDIEDIAKSFKGVREAYCFQAGREVRVIVNPEVLDDSATVLLSHSIKEKIEQNIKNFPGQIKITVIRELRATITAK